MFEIKDKFFTQLLVLVKNERLKLRIGSLKSLKLRSLNFFIL